MYLSDLEIQNLKFVRNTGAKPLYCELISNADARMRSVNRRKGDKNGLLARGLGTGGASNYFDSMPNLANSGRPNGGRSGWEIRELGRDLNEDARSMYK